MSDMIGCRVLSCHTIQTGRVTDVTDYSLFGEFQDGWSVGGSKYCLHVVLVAQLWCPRFLSGHQPTDDDDEELVRRQIYTITGRNTIAPE